MNFLADESVDRQIVEHLRLKGHSLSPTHKAGIVAPAIRNHLSELPQAFGVVTPGALRIRRRIG